MDNESCEIYDVPCHLGWLVEEFKALALWLYESILMGFSSLIDSIPVPDFLLNMGSFQLPPAISYFASPFQIEWGIAIVVSSYTARFILRRIPVIG